MRGQKEPHHTKLESERNLPKGYLEHNNTRLAFDEKRNQWVWPGGKRISCPKEAQENVVYLDRLVTGESKCVFTKSGYVSLANDSL